MLVRAVLAKWAADAYPSRRRVLEGDFNDARLIELNEDFYNIYFLPNHPAAYDPSQTVDGSHIDTFHWVFADMDLKEGKWASKEAFVEHVMSCPLKPTRVVDSGGGVHVYWRVSDLDAMSFLKLQRRICRAYKTDEAVAKIYQLMRLPGFVNTKRENDFQLCQELYSGGPEYTCEDLDRNLPPISHADEEYCQEHYNKTYNQAQDVSVDDTIPVKFMHLLRSNKEVKEIWGGGVDDRSKADWRLGHVMYANGFTREEARSVLINSSKALSRAPKHRVNYATGIVDKIWEHENAGGIPGEALSASVAEILNKAGSTLKGTRFPCWRWLDDTEHGFRLGQVIGLVAGVGVGKTAMSLNAFMGFVRNNPDYDHFFVPLEQPQEEIADRWRTMCGDDTTLHSKVQILSNYAADGSYRHLSLDEIKEYVLQYQKASGRKVGAVVIDHIGVLKKKSADGENQGLMDICHQMKAFAIQTNTLLIMQSQAPREKAGVGDLELDKDAAYGTVFFESYCDYLVTIWQPLKRCYKEEGCPTVTAYKFCKIRHKKQGKDRIIEDSPYLVFYDSSSQLMREMTQVEEKAFQFWNNQATNLRKKDRKTDLVTYTKISFEEAPSGATKNPEATGPVRRTSGVYPH